MAAIPIKTSPVLACAFFLAFISGESRAQTIESVGNRALGMGGAFVAVASDSSATWWNPAGLADGPFLDLALGRNVTERPEMAPLSRERTTSIALGTPILGLSYYRFQITDIDTVDPTASDPGSRQDGRAGIPARSLTGSQLGISLVQTVMEGLHAGVTLKYVRGTLRSGLLGVQLPLDEQLDAAEDFEGGDGDADFDLDVGLLAVGGPIRLGAVMRNILEPEFSSAGGATLRLPRQLRVGAAFDAEKISGPALTIAVDADVQRTTTVAGERRTIAVGAEQWLYQHRLGLRGGARFNRVGGEERSATAGVSVAMRSGLYLDGHVVRGGAADDQGWGAAVRVSF
jgi:hypothetical protein